MKYFVLLTGLILACYLLGFIKKPEKYQWMDRNYTTAIKGFSILTVVWAHSGAMLSVGGLQFIASEFSILSPIIIIIKIKKLMHIHKF